jgi:hypothetical protein
MSDAIDKKVKFHFPGPVQDLPVRKIDPEIVDINDHNEIVSALVEALEFLLVSDGCKRREAESIARAAIAKAKGETK